MKKLVLFFTIFSSFQAFALSAKLNTAVSLVENCLKTEGTLLCDDKITDELKAVHLDARGEFVYYLKDLLNKNENEKVIINLYNKLQVLVPIYEELDTCSEWSCRDLKIFLGDVSTRYVKVSPIDSDLYIKLYKSQAVQSGRYNLLVTLSDKASKATKVEEMDEMIKFAEFAKNHSRSIGDEYYLYQAGVAIVRNMTLASIKVRPGHEGIYKIKFDNEEVNKALKIDNVVVMESNYRDALVVNFVSSKSRVVRVSFKQSGLLGNTFFSNEDVYNNDNSLEIQSPYFKMELDRATGTVRGYFQNARYGRSYFTGTQTSSNLSVFSLDTTKGLTTEALVGQHLIKVGNYNMTLNIGKRDEDRSTYEGSLVSSNALISFNKVTFDSAKGVLSLVDSLNEKKLTLAVRNTEEGIEFYGEFLNAPIATTLDVSSL